MHSADPARIAFRCYLYAAVALLAISQLSPTLNLGLAGIGLCIAGVLGILSFSLLGDRIGAFFIFLLISTFIPVTLSLSTPGQSSLSVQVSTGLKELFLGIFLLLLLADYYKKLRSLSRLDLWLFAFLLWCAMTMFFSSAPLAAKVASLKDIAVIFSAYFVGRLVFFDHNSDTIARFSYWATICLLPVLAFTFVSSFFTGEQWESLGVQQYFQLKFARAEFAHLLQDGLPPNFYTYIFGERYPRNVGAILDAPGLSRFLSFFFVLYYCRIYFPFINREKIAGQDILLLALITIAQLTTLSRGGLLIDFIAVVIIFHYTRGSRLIVLLALAIAITVVSYFMLSGDANTDRHVVGFTSAFTGMSLRGNGLGTGGQQALTYAAGSAAILAGVRESFVGSLIYQCGLIGLMIFIAILAEISRLALSKSSIRSMDRETRYFWLTATSTCLAALLTSIMANSAVSFYAITLPMFALGLLVSHLKSGT